MRSLSIWLILVTISGCCSTQPVTIPLPDCKDPIPVDAQIWNDLGLMREVMSENSLRYQQCIEMHKARIVEFNE